MLCTAGIQQPCLQSTEIPRMYNAAVPLQPTLIHGQGSTTTSTPRGMSWFPAQMAATASKHGQQSLQPMPILCICLLPAVQHAITTLHWPPQKQMLICN